MGIYSCNSATTQISLTTTYLPSVTMPASYQITGSEVEDTFFNRYHNTLLLDNFEVVKTINESNANQTIALSSTFRLRKDPFTEMYRAEKVDSNGSKFFYESGIEYFVDGTGRKTKRNTTLSEFFGLDGISEIEFERSDTYRFGQVGSQVFFEIQPDYFEYKDNVQCLFTATISDEYIVYLRMDLKYTVSGIPFSKTIQLTYHNIGMAPEVTLPSDLSEYAY